MADEIEVPGVEGIKNVTQTVVEDFKTPRKHIWLLLIIGGGLVALALLIKHSAKTIAPATPAAATLPTNVNGTTDTPASPATAPTSQPKPPPAPKPPIPTPFGKPPTHLTYIVEPGDTLSSIAAKFHITLSQLEAAPGNYTIIFNNAHKHGYHSNEWNYIDVGEMLFIPIVR